MKIKKIPQRTCVITHEKLDKKDLFRVVRNKDGEVFIDETGKMNEFLLLMNLKMKLIKKVAMPVLIF